jgi:DNA-binding FadR family transcriptional regulator
LRRSTCRSPRTCSPITCAGRSSAANSRLARRCQRNATSSCRRACRAARYINLFVHGRGISLKSVLQTREAIEPSLARLAALNRSDAELEDLVCATERVEQAYADTPLYLAENVKWHCAIATASHNELLRAFMGSSIIYKDSAIENFATEDVRRVVIKAHRRILDAIVAGDGAAAERRMARHLAALREQMQAFPDAPAYLA